MLSFDIIKKKVIYKGSVIQYSKDSKDPKRRLIYNTVVELLRRKEDGEPITIKQIANEVVITRNTVYRINKEIKLNKNTVNNAKNDD